MKKSKNGATIMKHRHDRFTVVPREVTSGKAGLSLRATGLLCHLLGMPDDWRTFPRQIGKTFGCSRDVVQNILRELRDAGYATLDRPRNKLGLVLGTCWRISDRPEFSIRKHAPTESRKNRLSVKTDNRLKPAAGKTDNRFFAAQQNTDCLTEDQKDNHNNPAGTAEGGGCPAFGSNGNASLRSANVPLPAKDFVYTWQVLHKCWFGIHQHLRAYDITALEEFFAQKPSDEVQKKLIKLACTAWLDREEAPVKHNGGRDAWFNRTKAVSIGFLLNNCTHLEAEIESARYTSYEMTWAKMEETVRAGRGAFTDGI